jgi:hypothetical protein
LVDARKNSALQYHHWRAAEEHEPFSDGYFSRMEELLLGVRPTPIEPQPEPQSDNSQMKNGGYHASHPPEKTSVRPSQGLATEPPTPQPAPARPEYKGPPISAPPSREVHMSTGIRSPGRITLSPAEIEAALSSRSQHDAGVSDQELIKRYAEGKARFERLKSQGQYPER